MNQNNPPYSASVRSEKLPPGLGPVRMLIRAATIPVCLALPLLIASHASFMVGMAMGTAWLLCLGAALYRPDLVLALILGCTPLLVGIHVTGLLSGMHLMPVFFICPIILARQFRRPIQPADNISVLTDALSLLVSASSLEVFMTFPESHLIAGFTTMDMENQITAHHSAYAAAMLFLGLRTLSTARDVLHGKIRIQRWMFTIQALTVIGFFLIQTGLHIPPPRAKGFFSPFQDIHAAGSSLLLLFFLFLSMAFSGPMKKTSRILCVLLGGCVLLSFSRTAWLAGLLTAVFFFIARSRIRTWLLLGTAGLVSACLGLSALNSAGYDVGAGLFDMRTVKERVLRWETAVEMIGESPLSGHGIGTFYRVHPHFSGVLDDPADPAPEPENAHSYLLQFGSDLGLPALLLFLSLAIAILKRPTDPDDRCDDLNTGLKYGLSAYLLTCITGHPLLLFDQNLLFWGSAGVLLSNRPPRVPSGKYPAAFFPAVMITALFFAGLLGNRTTHVRPLNMGIEPPLYLGRSMPSRLAGPAYIREKARTPWLVLNLTLEKDSPIRHAEMNIKVDGAGEYEVNMTRPGRTQLLCTLPGRSDTVVRIMPQEPPGNVVIDPPRFLRIKPPALEDKENTCIVVTQ